MKRCLLILLIFLCITISFSGCNFMPSPDSTISSPRPRANIQRDNLDENSIITGFLPPSARLYIPKKSNKKSPIYSIDLDGDTVQEKIFVYEDEKHIVQSGFMVLRAGEKVWENIFHEKEEFKSITVMDFVDLTGDNLPEIIVGYGDSLAIYNYKNETYKKEITIKFTDYRIDDLSNKYGKDKMTELLIYNKNLETPEMTVLRWTGYMFQNVSSEFPECNNELISYFEGLKENNHNKSSYWYSYAQIQYKAENYSLALDYINEAFFIENHPTKKAQYLLYKAQVLMALGDYKGAIGLVSSEQMQRDNVIKQSKAIIAKAYFEQGDYLLARRIYKDISIFPYEETLQRVDTTLAENNIASYIIGHSNEDPNNLPKKLSAKDYAEYNNLAIASVIPISYTPKIKNAIVLHYNIISITDYYVIESPKTPNNSVKVKGNAKDISPKNSIGAHVIFWWENGVLKKTSFTTIDLYSDHHLSADLVPVAANIKEDENNSIILRVTYKNEAPTKNSLPESFNQSFILNNGAWKFLWK